MNDEPSNLDPEHPKGEPMNPRYERYAAATRDDNAEAISALAQSVTLMAESADELRGDVRVIEESSRRDRQLLRMLTGFGLLLLVLVVITTATAISNKANGDYIKDCTTPTGKCYQRTNRGLAAIVQSITYRTEGERLRTEIRVAQANGDQPAAANRQARLAEVESMIRYSDEVVTAARNGTPAPPAPITTLPVVLTPSTVPAVVPNP